MKQSCVLIERLMMVMRILQVVPVYSSILGGGTYSVVKSNARELAKKHDIIKPALGFYPVHAVEVSVERSYVYLSIFLL